MENCAGSKQNFRKKWTGAENFVPGEVLRFFPAPFIISGFLSIVLLKASQFNSIVATCHCGPDVLALCMQV